MFYRVADISFKLTPPKGFRFQQTLSLYRDFFSPDAGIDLMKPIETRISIRDLEDKTEQKPIFICHPLWSMYHTDKGYVIQTPDSETRFDTSFETVEFILRPGAFFVEEKSKSIRTAFIYTLDRILIMYYLSNYLSGAGGLIVHSAGAYIGGKGCLFLGKSGAGKSTISRLFEGRTGIRTFSDDRMIIRKYKNGYKAHGTPWAGDANITVNDHFPLSHIFFLNHGNKNEIKELSFSETLKKMMPVASIPWYDRDVFPPILDFCEKLIYEIPAHELTFTRDEKAVDNLVEFLSR